MDDKRITAEDIRWLLPQRPVDSNKGTFGKVLTIAGSYNYQGAAYLAAVSALKAGAGLVTLASTDAVIKSVAAQTPNVTFVQLKESETKSISSSSFEEVKPVLNGYTVLVMGPGLSETQSSTNFINNMLIYLQASTMPIVLDADALNIIASLGLKPLPQNSIITPHPKELSRLLRIPVEEIQENRIKAAKTASEKFGCITVLKGHETVVCTKDLKCFINTSGNTALAKAGSGDVLTGMIAGFLSQGASCENAAKLGVYLHGLTGEIASKDLTEYCVMAQDQIDNIPKAIKKVLE